MPSLSGFPPSKAHENGQRVKDDVPIVLNAPGHVASWPRVDTARGRWASKRLHAAADGWSRIVPLGPARAQRRAAPSP